MPSSHCVWVYEYWILTVKRAPEMSGFFNWIPLPSYSESRSFHLKQEKFKSKPFWLKSFECGHNYCEGCLITVRNGQDEWQCPESRRPHRKNVEDLTRNYLVERFLDAYRKEQKEKAESFDDGLCDLHQRPFELCKLTTRGQLSLQGTSGVWTDVKVLWTKADDGRVGK